MKTVYVVTHGDYSSYTIDGVFSTEEKAQEYINLIKGNKKINYWRRDFNDIIEYEIDNLDKISIKIKQEYNYYHVFMYRDGSSNVLENDPYTYENIELCKPDNSFRDKRSFISCYLWAKSPEHAVKIANEKRVQLIANGEWDE